jgi:hypothetical protein
MTTLTEVFPCLFFSCKANARVKPAKTRHGPHFSKFLCCSMYCLFRVVLFIFFVCLYMCTVLLPPGGYPNAVKHIIYHIVSYHTVSYHTIPYFTTSYIILYHISYHITSYHICQHITSYIRDGHLSHSYQSSFPQCFTITTINWMCVCVCVCIRMWLWSRADIHLAH